jgi:tetratricopeptide (TPR) repeat protein
MRPRFTLPQPGLAAIAALAAVMLLADTAAAQQQYRQQYQVRTYQPRSPSEHAQRPMRAKPAQAPAKPRISPAVAAAARNCADQAVANVQQRIDACTTLIQSGLKDEKSRAVAFGLRGLAYLDRSDLAHAIPDFDNSISLAQDDASVFQNRGNAWYARGNFGRAADDYEEAIKLDPEQSTI